MNSTAANLPRLRIFYTFYIFYTAITTHLPLQLFTLTPISLLLEFHDFLMANDDKALVK